MASDEGFISYWKEKWSSMNLIQKLIRISYLGAVVFVAYETLSKGTEYIHSMTELLSLVHQEQLQLLTLQDLNTLFVAWSLILGAFAIVLTGIVVIEILGKFSNFFYDFAEYYEGVREVD